MKVEVIYKDKYYLGELVRSITLEDSLDEIAYRAIVVLEYPKNFPTDTDISLGQDIRISGYLYGQEEFKPYLHNAVLWEIESNWQTHKELTFVIYDKCIYMKSEDEYLWQAGLTATKRIQKYLQDLGLRIGTLEDTKVKLPKTIYRAQSISSMVWEDLKATVAKGGEMYRLYMSPGGIELRKLGSNLGSNGKIYEFSTEEDKANIFEITQKRTLENMVSKVKVLGSAPDDMKSPVLATILGDTKYGIVQKILQDPDIENASEAEKKGRALLSGKEETFTFATLCIPQIRAGDKIKLNTMELLVYEVRHEIGESSRTTISAATEDYIRRMYYL